MLEPCFVIVFLLKMDSAMFFAGRQARYGGSRGGFSPQKRQWRSNDQNPRPRKRNKTSQRGSGMPSIAAGIYSATPRLMELQRQNRIRTRRHFPKRGKSVPRVPPRAPYNDSSYLMRVRQSGGLASSASPATPATPVTPAFISTPVFSSPAPQFREGPVGDVKDYGYGSMEGLIHLKSSPGEPSHASIRIHSADDVQGPPQSVQQVEQQLDHDVSRFEMTLPSGNSLSHRTQLMEVRFAEQESHIAYLEDENLTLKERLFLAEQEAHELRQRLQRGGSCISVIDEHDDACSDYGSSD